MAKKKKELTGKDRIRALQREIEKENQSITNITNGINELKKEIGKHLNHIEYLYSLIDQLEQQYK